MAQINGRHGYGRLPLPRGTLARSKKLEDYRRIAAHQDFQPGQTLDQGNTPRCVGYSGATDLNSAPLPHSFGNAYADELYRLCKVVDGDNEDGSTGLSLATVLKAKGFFPDYAFTQNVETAWQFVDSQSPVLIGSMWLWSMEDPDPVTGILSLDFDSGFAGGHEYCWQSNAIIGTKRYVRIQQTWGKWGLPYMGIPYGFGLIELSNLAKLVNLYGYYAGDILAAVEADTTPVPQPNGCLTVLAKAFRSMALQASGADRVRLARALRLAAVDLEKKK